jgi:hypothetical protein
VNLAGNSPGGVRKHLIPLEFSRTSMNTLVSIGARFVPRPPAGPRGRQAAESHGQPRTRPGGQGPRAARYRIPRQALLPVPRQALLPIPCGFPRPRPAPRGPAEMGKFICPPGRPGSPPARLPDDRRRGFRIASTSQSAAGAIASGAGRLVSVCNSQQKPLRFNGPFWRV